VVVSPRSISRRRIAPALVTLVAVFCAAYAAPTAQAAGEMRLTCVKKKSGLLRYAARAGNCRTGAERLFRIRDNRAMIACAHRGGYVYRAARRRACHRPPHRPSLALVMPGRVSLFFCAHKRTGKLRSTAHAPYPRPRRSPPDASACKRRERRVFVDQRNRGPAADDDRATVGEDAAGVVDVLANDTDPDGDALDVATVDASDTRGSVAIAADRRSVTYDPSGRFQALGAGATATDAFSYEATDGRLRDRADVTVTVRGANDAPAAAADAATTTEDAATTIAVLANDTDPDQGDALTVTAVDTGGVAGTVTIGAGGTLTYDPAGQFDRLGTSEQALERFGYTISDGHGGTASMTVTVTVTGTGDPPVTTTSAGAVTYTEGAVAVTVDPGLTVADADDATLESARVSIAAAFEPGDELQFVDQSGINGAYDAGTGALTLTGTATLAQYQAALRSVAYRHTGDDPATAKTVQFRAADGEGLGPAATRDVAVTTVNDAPAVAASGGSASFTEGAGPVAVDPGLAVDDPDSPLLSGATVTVASNLVEDELAFTAQLGITGAYSDATGTLTLTGLAPVASYRAALRSVTYDNSSNDPSTATRTISFQVTDAAALASNVASRDVTVAGDDDAPIVTVTGTSLAYAENDAATAVDNGLTVSDADDVDLEGATIRIATGFEAGDVLAFADQNGITGAYNAGTGVLTLAGTSSVANYQTALRSVTYAHTGDNPATAKAVEFKAGDGTAESAAAIRAIAVTRVNDAPVLDTSNAALPYTEDAGPVAADAGIVATDPDSDELSSATVEITANFDAAQDELAFADQLGITGAYDDVTGTLTLTGAAPVASYQAALRAVTYENESEGPSPATRTISFQAFDDQPAASNVATRGIAITGVNDPPTAVDDTGATDEDTVLNAAAPGVLANDTDVDPGDTKTVVQLNGSATLTGTSAKGASVTIAANGSYTYDPGAVSQGLSTGQTDTDSFTYTMADGAGAQSTATVDLTITGISDAPTANADSFDAIGNTGLFAGTTRPAADAGKEITGSVLANDTDPDTPLASLVAEPVTNAPTTLGGTITIEADGNFTYHPDDGDTGVTDTFTYRVCDASPCNSTTVANSTGTLNLPITGEVWYVRNNAPTGGDGTSDGPLDTLAEAESASGAGDTVYVFDGNNTSANLDTGYVMAASERLIGEHNGLSLDPDGSGGPLGIEALHVGTAGAHPTLAASNEDVVVLASGATVDGINIDPSGIGGGISGASGSVTINDVNVADGGTAGTQPGVDLDGTSGTSTVTDLTVSTNGATGVRLNNAGTVSFAPASTITISTAGARGLDATGPTTSLGTSRFDAITVNGSANGGVSMTNTTGTTEFGDLSLTTALPGTAPAFSLSNAGTVSVPVAGTANVNANGGPAVDVTGTSGATLGFDAVSSTDSTTDGVNLAGLGTGTFSATSGAIGGAAGIAFDLDGGSGAVSYPGALNNGSGATAEVTGRSGGAVTLSGAIADTNDAGGGISLSGNTGGSTAFSNAPKVLNTTTADAVSFTGSDGHTLNLTGGGLDIDTTTGRGILASNSGTLVVSGTGNTIDSTSATALSVTNTDIGATGATFQRISSGNSTAAADPPSGIVLDNTGTNSALTVTGTGGTCTNADPSGCSGGVIQNTTGADNSGAVPTGTGIVLNNTRGISLTRMHVHDHSNYGLRGTSVVSFALANSVINGTNGTDFTFLPDKESSVRFAELTGTVSVTDTFVSGGANNNVLIQNTSGTLNSTFTNLTSGAVSNSSAEDAMMVEGIGTATTNATVQSSSFTNAPADIFLYIGDGTGGGTLNFTGNAITNNHPAIVTGGGGVTLAGGANGATTMNVQNNTMRDSHAAGLDVNKSSGSGSLTATINNNDIGVTGVANSGSLEGNGLDVRSGQGNATYTVTNNEIRQYNSHGMAFFVGTGTAGQSGNVNINLSGNTVQEPGTNPNITLFQGIRAESGISMTDTFQTCLNIGSGNLITGSSDAPNKDWRVLGFGSTTVRLPTYGGGAQDDAAAATFINGRFGGGANGVASSDGSSAWSGSGTSCP
jgi:VCBS repeat-containing protein